MVTWHKAISLHCQLILACRHVRYAAGLPHTPHQPPSLHPRLSAAEERSEHTERNEKSSLPSRTSNSAGWEKHRRTIKSDICFLGMRNK